MKNGTLVLAASMAWAAPAALADALPPPAQHSDLQSRLNGVWQEQACHNPPAMHHSEPCELRTIAFGDTTIAVLSTISVRDETSVTASAGSWTGESSAAGATIRSDTDTRAWVLTFPDRNSFVVAGYDRFPAAQFKRLGAAQ